MGNKAESPVNYPVVSKDSTKYLAQAMAFIARIPGISLINRATRHGGIKADGERHPEFEKPTFVGIKTVARSRQMG